MHLHHRLSFILPLSLCITSLLYIAYVPLFLIVCTFNNRNWLIHQLYIRGEFSECLKIIEIQLQETQGQSEYPIYIKALIRRHEGKIVESLQLFQAATILNPHNVQNLKQVGRSL